MHIVIITDHGHLTGGIAKVAIDSAIGLAKRGHQVVFFAAVGPIDQRLSAAGVEIICLEQSDLAQSPIRGLTQGIWNGTARKALQSLMTRLPTGDTAIHVHGWAKALSPSISSAVANSGHAVFYTLHDYFLFCPNGGFYNYQKGQICHLKPMSSACIAEHCDSRSYVFKLWRVARQAVADKVAHMGRNIPNLILISQLQQEIIGSLLDDSVKIHRISNPISIPDKGPKSTLQGDFVFVGRVSREKGAATFLEAARRANARAVIVGDGPDLPALKEAYPNAIFLGWLSPAQVEEQLRQARALVFPSVWYEGQPLTVYEALALGTPVIVSDACAGREAVADGITGLWFKASDPEDLQRAIGALQNDALAREMSQAAYVHYWSNALTPDRHLDQLEVAYLAALPV